MLVRSRVVVALQEKRHLFQGHHTGHLERLNRYRDALGRWAAMGRSEILALLEPLVWPGALPSAEHDRHHAVIVSFDQRWASHQEAREWAAQVLQDQPVFAVDGSQILPSRDFSIPVAAVQIGWFENSHAAGLPYVKDLSFEVLSPAELFGPAESRPAPHDADADVAGMFGDNLVNLHRFAGECDRLREYMRAAAGRMPRPLCLFDGSLVVSFAANLTEELRQRYVEAMAGLLRTSRETRVPLVGYVDTSYARDLCSTLRFMFDLPADVTVNDGQLLSPLMVWGDRCPVHLCRRDDGVLPLYGDVAQDVCFTYVKTTAEGQPARVEMPAWLLDEPAEMERVLGLLRAECVVGNGYPYALETADVVAVISMEDREAFYATFQRFAEMEGLPLRYSRKSLSKRFRR